MELKVEKSKKEDCKEITEFITKVWNETYKDIINDNFLKLLKENEKKRTQNAINNFDEKNNLQYIIKKNNKIIAFLKLNKVDNEEKIEIQSLYVLKEYQNQGIGKYLLKIGFKEAKKMGYNEVFIGCLEKNKSNEFYKKMGGLFINKREFKLSNQTLYENVYKFNL